MMHGRKNIKKHFSICGTYTSKTDMGNVDHIHIRLSRKITWMQTVLLKGRT